MTIPIIVQGESIQERAEAAGAKRRDMKRLKAKRSPALTKDDSPPPRKKMAKVEVTATAVKVPDYANMQEADDESARVRTKPLRCRSRNLSCCVNTTSPCSSMHTQVWLIY